MGLVSLLVAASLVQAPAPDLSTVLQRAATYVAQFYARFSGIVAEEDYTQSWRKLVRVTPRGAVQNQREQDVGERRLRSDLALLHPAGGDEWLQFRDVFDVDGSPVRDRQDRLSKIFLDPSATTLDRIARIKAESARYNLGDIERNLNTPLFALQILLPYRQTRFRFKRTGRRDIANLDLAPDANGVFHASTEVWVIEYDEVSHPTLIRTGAPKPTRDLPAHGRFWIEPSTGRVLMTELRAGNRDIKGTIDVSYQSEPLLGLLVPVEMREDYRDGNGSHVTGVARYGRFRQFDVRVDETFFLKR
jgi:hypothetical protein